MKTQTATETDMTAKATPMKAIAVRPGAPGSVHVAELTKPSLFPNSIPACHPASRGQNPGLSLYQIAARRSDASHPKSPDAQCSEAASLRSHALKAKD